MEDHANLSRAAISSHPGFGGLIGESACMRHLNEVIERVCQSASPVLLLGETGTGKELVARSIHYQGLRREKAFVPVDCSALSPTLVESELFGHVKGAFTGADHAKRGLLQIADKGTVFLDEVGELPVFMQARLLRALQEKEIRPVGSVERIPINVRIVAATNRDLDSAVRQGTFRRDLFFRLNVVQIHLPPLRERKVDIPLLVNYFLERFSSERRQVHALSDKALRRLMAYDWPGNVRELQNAVERAMAFISNGTLAEDDFTFIPNGFSAHDLPGRNELVPLAEMERRAILRALEETRGDKLAAARLLGIGKTTLYRKLQQYRRNPSNV